MIPSLALVLLVTLSGTVATYLYDEKASLAARLCSGACLGIAALGLIGFVAASSLGLTNATVLLTAIICAAPLCALANNEVSTWAKEDIRTVLGQIKRFISKPDSASIGYGLFYLIVAVTLWQVFNRAMIQDEEGISTGLLNNFGDLPFHLSVITGFAHGNNFPPDDPTYAGVRFTYPFLSDFVSAVFVQCGADLRESMLIENYVLAVSFVGLLHRWAWVMLRDKLAAIVTPLLVLLNGGFGWILLYTKAKENSRGLVGVLSDLPPSFTVIPETTWRWGNAISALLIPQRGFLLGLPLAVIVFTQWWLSEDRSYDEMEAVRPRALTSRQRKQQKKSARTVATRREISSLYYMIAGGVAAGLLPLVHAHSFVVVMVVGACLALIQRRWSHWFAFFATASLIALPQLFWSTSHSAVKASAFFAWETGWDHGQENPVWFWFKNTGLFIPLICVAIFFRSKGPLIAKRVLWFYAPFVLCFIVPNFIKLAPWVWDNIKVLYYWWLASAPIVAVLLAHLWRAGKAPRLLAVALFVCLTLAGALDVAAIAIRDNKYGIFDRAGLSFAELIKKNTSPRALIVHAPVHNDPVFLSGRRSLLGYPGHVWTHGLDFVERESEIKKIYAGAPEADQLLRTYDIDYIVIGPLERQIMPINQQYFSHFKKVGEVGEYALYQVKSS